MTGYELLWSPAAHIPLSALPLTSSDLIHLCLSFFISNMGAIPTSQSAGEDEGCSFHVADFQQRWA